MRWWREVLLVPPVFTQISHPFADGKAFVTCPASKGLGLETVPLDFNSPAFLNHFG